jgi:Tfp pilus assembly protein PilO
MRQSAKRLISSLVSLFFVIGAFIVFFDFLQPKYGELVDLKSQVESKRIQLETEQRIVGDVKKLVNTFNSSANDRLQAGFSLPTSTMAAEALAQIHGIAATNHMLTAQSYGVTVPQDQVTSEDTRRQNGQTVLSQPVVPISIQARFIGSYGEFKGFLRNVETNVRIFDVKSISIQPASKANQDLYNFDIRVVAYYQKIPVAPTTSSTLK